MVRTEISRISTAFEAMLCIHSIDQTGPDRPLNYPCLGVTGVHRQTMIEWRPRP